MIKSIAKKIAIKVKPKKQTIENGIEYTRIKRKVITKIKRRIGSQSEPPTSQSKLIQVFKQITLAVKSKHVFTNLKDKFHYFPIRRSVQESDPNETFQTEFEVVVPSEESDPVYLPLQF